MLYTPGMEQHTLKKALYGTAIGAMALISIAALSYAHSYARSFSPENGWNTLAVSGTGTATGIPDIAEISFSATTDASEAQAAQEGTSAKMDAIMKYLMEQGVEKEDIRTTSYAIDPKQEYVCGRAGFPCTSKANGYTATQSVSVKVRDTAKVGALIAGVVEKGATGTSGPTFVMDDPSALEADARGKAIEDAKKKAESIARQSGIRLGKLLSVSDDGAEVPYPYEKAAAPTMSAVADQQATLPNVQPGSQEVKMHVTLTYALR